LEAQPWPAPSRRVWRRAHGQQRPDPESQRVDAADAQGGVMPTTVAITPSGGDVAQQKYLDELLRAGLLIDSGVRGVYGLGGAFEGVIERFAGFVSRMGADRRPDVMRFPPVLSRATYLRTGHL